MRRQLQNFLHTSSQQDVFDSSTQTTFTINAAGRVGITDLIFFLGPTFANVWEQTLWNVCKTLCIRYAIVQFVKPRLSFRVRLTIVRKRWHSFALYIAYYKEWAALLCASGVGTPWRMRRGCVACSTGQYEIGPWFCNPYEASWLLLENRID